MSEPAPASKERSLPALVTRRVAEITLSYPILFAFVALIVLFSLMSPVFLTEANILNIGRQTAIVSIVAVGMTFVIVSGEIDLSVGSALALAGMLAALAMQELGNIWVIGALAALGTGALVGLVNGAVTSYLAIPSFLVTLGMLGIARGIANLVTGTKPVIINNYAQISIFGSGTIFGVPAPIVWTVVVLVLGGVGLHVLSFGRRVFATGGNAQAARYSGINTRRVKTASFVLLGLLVGLAALVQMAVSQAARPDLATGLELDVLAAVILGGASLSGGRGTIFGTLLGSLTIGVLTNGLTLMGVNAQAQLVVKGLIIIVAAGLAGATWLRSRSA